MAGSKKLTVVIRCNGKEVRREVDLKKKKKKKLRKVSPPAKKKSDTAKKWAVKLGLCKK